MGLLTLTQLRDELVLELGGRTDSTVSDTRKDLWLNASLRHIGMPNIYKHPELWREGFEPLVLDTARYELDTATWGFHPTAISSVVYYRTTTNPPPDTVLFDKLDPDPWPRHLLAGSTPQGPPTHYMKGPRRSGSSRQLVLSNRPGTNEAGNILGLTGWARPTTLTTPSQTTEISPEWDEVILTGAKWRGYSRLGDAARAAEAREMLAAQINEVVEILRVENEDADDDPVEVVIDDYQEMR